MGTGNGHASGQFGSLHDEHRNGAERGWRREGQGRSDVAQRVQLHIVVEQHARGLQPRGCLGCRVEKRSRSCPQHPVAVPVAAEMAHQGAIPVSQATMLRRVRVVGCRSRGDPAHRACQDSDKCADDALATRDSPPCAQPVRHGDYDYTGIYKGMAHGVQTDKSFSLPGRKALDYLDHRRLQSPAIDRSVLKQLVSDDGANALQPDVDTHQ